MSLLRGNGGVLGTPNIPTFSVASGRWNASYIARQFNGLANGLQFPPNTQDPNFSSVTFLIHTDEIAKGMPNHGSVGNNISTVNGLYSTSTSNLGAGSLQILTSVSGIIFGSNVGYSMGSGDFTLELWVNPTNVGSSVNLWDFRNSATSVCPLIGWGGPGSGALQFYVNGANRITSSNGALVVSAWQHIAVARASGTTKMFLNGTQVGSNYTDANNYSSAGFELGNSNTPSGIGAAPALCYIAEARITKGVARYTANFTPPTVRFPDF